VRHITECRSTSGDSCFWWFKEAIHNIAKHSGASRAVLRLQIRAGLVCGELIDDGCGLSAAQNRGTGVVSMRARVAQLGGSIDIAPTAGGGTRVHIHMPLANDVRSMLRHE
jgi:signal transduction histidine kinase